MKKKRKLVLGWTGAVSVMILLVLVYILISTYYEGSFYPGTYANGIYCTGRSIEAVNEELKGLYEEESFFIQDSYGHAFEILLSDIRFEIDYTSQLLELQNPKNTVSWLLHPEQETYSIVRPGISFDEALLKEALLTTGLEEILSTDTASHDTAVEIRRGENGYELYDGRKFLLDREQVYEKVAEALQAEIYSVDITGCYVDLPYTEEMLATIDLFKKVEEFQTCHITYDMGDTLLALSPDIVADWITLTDEQPLTFALDETDNLVLNEEAMISFVDGLCEEFDTYKSTRTFLASRGDEITIEGGTYGNQLDREAEIAYLTEAFQAGVNEVHVPAYKKEAFTRGKNDIGDTYVEIDMTEQKLYYYEEGELLIETDIVTGNMRRGFDTPEGVNFVYNMQKNRTLRGTGYTAFVKYWVPVVGGIGIHDASWRSDFGGDIYKTNGSHGCINVPSEVMPDLYELLEIGVPVVMFY